MRLLDTSAITTTNAMPLKAGSLVHVQAAYKEIISETLIRIAGASYSSSTPYRIEGLINVSGTVSAGSIFFNGEVFLVDSFTLPSPANASISTTFFTDVSADPVDFTDGTPRSIHQIRKIVFGSTSGLGFAFSDLLYIGAMQWAIDNSSTSFSVKFDKSYATFRSFVVSGGTTFTINLDGTNAVDGIESVIMFQSAGSAIAFTINQTNGIVDLMGVGGYSNPLTITVANTGYFVMRFKCWKPGPLGGSTMISINVSEHT